MFTNCLVTKKIGKHIYAKKNNLLLDCVEKGKSKYKGIRIELGDYLDIEPTSDSSFCLIEKIHERKNLFYRPRIANVDQVLIIASLREPNLNTLVLNRYILFCMKMNVKLIICFTKKDLINSIDKSVVIKKYQKLGFDCFLISNISDKSLPKEFANIFVDKITLCSGQSGSGKSTLLNRFEGDLNIRTQSVSTFLNTGKHTTTSSQLYYLNGGYIADTPGFSKFEFKDIEAIEIARLLQSHLNVLCKFNNCLHLPNALDCNVNAYFTSENNLVFFKNDYDKIIEEVIVQNKNRRANG